MSKLIVFHGVDNKVGTTMVAQSVAELLSADSDSVIFLALNGRESKDFIRDEIENIDYMKDRLDSGVLEAADLINLATDVNGLKMIGGIVNEENARSYMPEAAKLLISKAMETFDIVVVDAGNSLDNGLALGALQMHGDNILVLTQQESVIARWEKRRFLYEKLDILPKLFLINKYLEKDFYDMAYLEKRLSVSKEQVFKIHNSMYARQAEVERKTLVSLSDRSYKEDFINLISNISSELLKNISIERKRRWLSFI